jgi:hypothetical protein
LLDFDNVYGVGPWCNFMCLMLYNLDFFANHCQFMLNVFWVDH